MTNYTKFCINKRIKNMESNDESKEIVAQNRTCKYFNDIIKNEDFDLVNIFFNEKSYEKISIYIISYKTLIGAKPLPIRFDKINVFIRVYDGTRYLVIFGREKNDAIYNRIRYLINQKKVVLHMFFLMIIQELKLNNMILCL